MAKSTFINVLSPACKDGNVVFNFTERNKQAPANFSITVALVAGDDEVTIATKLWTAIDAGFTTEDVRYSGQPTFFTDAPALFTFTARQTENILEIWSQGDYGLTVTNTATKSSIVLHATPLFGTIEQVKDLAPVSGVKLTGTNNVALSDNAIVSALKAASARIVSTLNGFNVIPATYLQVENGEWQRGVCCRYAPVISRSPILGRGPYTPNWIDMLSISVVQRVEFDPFTGTMFFLDWNNSIGISEVTAFGNGIIWTYVAGHEYVSETLAQTAVQLIGMAKVPNEIESFKGASFAMTFRKPTEATQYLSQQLQQFAV